jgi:hypothetical protein
MTLTRRHFGVSSMLVTAAAAAGLVAESGETAAAATPGHPLARATFAPLVGRYLTVTRAGRSTTVRLRKIRNVVGARSGSNSSFVLSFSTPRHLTDGLYHLSHPAAGTHLVFLSGVNAAAQRRYEVVVNRSAPATTT